MMAKLLSWLFALMGPTLLLFVFALVYGKKKKVGYSFLTQFPFEMVENDISGRVVFYVYAAVEALCGAYMLLTNDLHAGLLPFSILYLVAMALKAIALAAVVSVPAYEFKPHLFAFTCYGAINALSAAIATILLINLAEANTVLSAVFAVIVGLLGLIGIGVFLNPKLAHWTELKSTVEEDGTIVTSRPRPFVLAFSEWITIFLSFASTLLSLLGFALIGLSQL